MRTTHNDRQVETGRFLGLLFNPLDEEERIEGRWTRPGGGGSMVRDFFLTSDEFARKAFSIAPTHDVYVGVAARRGNVGTRDGVNRIRAIWGDLDFKDGHTPESRDSQLRRLACVPSMVVLSGGGCHVYWLLEEPAEGPKVLNRAEMVMSRIAEGLGGDPVQDLPRILRVPGTYNHKTDNPRPVRLAHCEPTLRHTLEQLERMAEGLPTRGRNSGGLFGRPPKNVLGGPITKNRNVAVTSVAGSLRDRGLDKDTIRVVLLEVNRLRCEPPLPEHEVLRIGRSVGNYRPGNPRYLGSSARRVFACREVG